MYLGVVTGTVVASRKAAGLEGQKLLLVQPVDDVGVPTEAIDEVDVEARMAALTAIGIDQPSATDTAAPDDDPPGMRPVARSKGERGVP